jgi:ATP-dependent RNA helicase DeaD
MLSYIERATKQSISPMDLPSVKDINKNRVARFKETIVRTLNEQNLDLFSQIIAELQQEKELSSEQIAAAAAFLAQGDTPLMLSEKAIAHDEKPRSSFDERNSNRRRDDKPKPGIKATPLKDFPDIEMKRFRLDVGRSNKVKPSNIVGAIANEAELESKYIGEIEIRERYSTVDLPADMPKEIMAILKKARVAGRALSLRVYDGKESGNDSVENEFSKPARKSYNSKKKDRNSAKKTLSEYANTKRKQRSKKNKSKG